MYTFLSFEGGGALPEDTSREGCGVGTPETCNTDARKLGRLGGDKKNHSINGGIALRAVPGTPLFSSAYAPYLFYLSNSMVHKKLSKNVSIDEILAKKTPI